MNSTKIKFVVFFAIISLSQSAFCQNVEIDSYLSNYNMNDFFIVRKIRPNVKKQRNNLEVLTVEEIQKKMIETLSQNIKESNVKLKGHSIEYWGLLEFKMGLKGSDDNLVDVLTVNKQELGKRILARIKKQYTDIKLSLSLKENGNLENTNQVQALFQDVEKKLSLIEIEEELLLKVAPDLIDKENILENLKEDISKSKNELRSKFNVQKRTFELDEVNSLYISGKYLEAYKKFSDLYLLYNDIEFLQGIEKSKGKIQDIYSSRLKEFRNRKNYRNALLAIDTLERSGSEISLMFEQEGIDTKAEYFNSIAVTIDNLLSFSSKSNNYTKATISQISSYMAAIKPYAEVTPKTHAKFVDFSNRVFPLMQENDINEINSYIYKNDFSSALHKMQEIKAKYPQNKKIEQIETKLQDKAFNTKKKEFLATKPRIISIEPGYNLISPEVNLESFNISKTENFNPLFQLGIYQRYGFKRKNSTNDSNDKIRFGYNQIGLKFEYLDVSKTYFLTDSLSKDKNAFPARSYSNVSLSILLGKTLGLDVGYLTYNTLDKISTASSLSKTVQPNGFYTGGIVFYIPMGGFSLGVGSKVISDFKSYNHAQFSFNFKFNFGAIKKFNQDDKQEIKNQINKFSF